MYSFEYSEINDQIRQTVRKFAQEEILPGVIERDEKAEFPHEIIKQLSDLGMMGFMVNPEYGGAGLDAVSFCICMEEICKVDASIGIVISVHNSLVNWIIETYGSDFLKNKYLHGLATGELIGAYCLSESEAGSDATRQNTIAEYKDGFWILNGMKSWISSAHHADVFVVFAQTNPGLGYKGISAFLVEKGTEGFEPLRPEIKMGMRSDDTSAIALTNVKVPEENVIGEVGRGFYIAMEGLNNGRIGIAAQSVGIAQGAFEAALKYAKERKTFGKPIIDHQLIGAKLAQMSMKIEAARLLVFQAAYLKDTKQNLILAASQAKLYASTIANEVCRDAVQIFGGYGYTREYHVERMMRDAKVTEIYEGTSEIQHIVIARHLNINT
jgi:alkylation response protein AidB-like acyl-CoA dehydrogenase